MIDALRLIFVNFMKILFVCLGNICRSPIAEGVFRRKLAQSGLNWQVASCGTNRRHKGDPADERTVEACALFGTDISTHIARRFRTEDFTLFDLIICMASDVYEEMQEFVTDPAQLNKVLVKEFHDPYYGGMDGFKKVYADIEAYCDRLIQNADIISLLKSSNEESFTSAMAILGSL